MGSLVPSWDSNTPGVPPKGWQDYEEPCTPRGRSLTRDTSTVQGELSRQLSRQLSSPPSLRTSAPMASTRQQSLPRSLTIGKRPSLARSSMDQPMSPRSPRECYTPRMATSLGSPSTFMARYHEMGEGAADDIKKERWCDRMDSHVLNVRPDEGDELAWRHGNFKPQADVAVQHLAAQGQRRVSVERVTESLQRASVDGVKTPLAQPRGNGRDVSPTPSP